MTPDPRISARAARLIETGSALYDALYNLDPDTVTRELARAITDSPSPPRDTRS